MFIEKYCKNCKLEILREGDVGTMYFGKEFCDGKCKGIGFLIPVEGVIEKVFFRERTIELQVKLGDGVLHYDFLTISLLNLPSNALKMYVDALYACDPSLQKFDKLRELFPLLVGKRFVFREHKFVEEFEEKKGRTYLIPVKLITV